MKKKLLVCIQNSYVLNQYEGDFKKLSSKFDITLIISNSLVDKEKRQNLYKFAESVSISNLFIVPFYSKKFNRNILDLIKTHLFLVNLKKKINFHLFSTCISDSKFFIWHRIILETFLSKSCVQIGISHAGLTMPMEKFEELLNGADIYKIVKSLHKLREVKKKEKKRRSIFNKFTNIKQRFLDIIFDRRILSYLFHRRNFNYKHLDFNLSSETEKFDHRITFFYSTFYFWDKWYNNQKVYICRNSSECVCKNEDKNKILFLSSSINFLEPFNNTDNTKRMMDDVVNNVNSFMKKIKNENPEVHNLDIRHHPAALLENINLFEKKLKEKAGDEFIINSISVNKNINKIACSYKVAFGPISSALKYLQNCNNIKIYSLKSLSKPEFGEKYFLKLLNEKIIFYDDENKIEDENYKKYKNLIIRKEKDDLFSLITKTCK